MWYENNLCNTRLTDPRGHRVRFVADDFVHLIKLVNKHGDEPRNRRLAIEEIKRGGIHFIPGRFDEKTGASITIRSDPRRGAGLYLSKLASVGNRW